MTENHCDLILIWWSDLNMIGLNIFIPQYVHEQYKDMQKH